MVQNYENQNYPHQGSQNSMRDIVLNPHEYCYIQDLNTGLISESLYKEMATEL